MLSKCIKGHWQELHDMPLTGISQKWYVIVEGAGLKHDYQVYNAKENQAIYTGWIPSYYMQKHLLLERFMALIQSTYKPALTNYVTN